MEILPSNEMLFALLNYFFLHMYKMSNHSDNRDKCLMFSATLSDINGKNDAHNSFRLDPE